MLLLSRFSRVQSVRPHRWQPTGLPHPRDSPGKNTGVGCHFFLQCMKSEKWNWSRSVMSDSSDPMDCSLPGSSIHGIFQTKVLEWDAIALWDEYTCVSLSLHIYIYTQTHTHTIIYIYIHVYVFVGEGDGTPLQYACLENPMDGGAWKAAVHGVAEGWTWLSDFTFTFHFHALEREMATHSSVIAWRIPGTGESTGLPSLGSHRVGHDWSDLAAAAAYLFVYVCVYNLYM